MMKKTINKTIRTLLLLFVAVGFILTSCNDDSDKFSGFQIDKEEITVGAEGGVDQIRIQSADEWVALASEPWVMITPANGVGSTDCSIVIDSTLVNDIRTATIRFTPNGQEPRIVTVKQTGFDKVIALEEREITVEPSALMNQRNFSTVVTTNVNFKVNIEYISGSTDWLDASTFNVELDRGARPRTTTLKFDWRMNPTSEERVAKVNFIPSSENDKLSEPVFLTVTQKGAPRIEDNRAGDSLAILTIAEKLQCGSWDNSDNMRNWDGVDLWEETDKDLPASDAVGRVRSVSFVMCNTKESLPQEVRHLKYVETFSVFSNVNTMLLSIELGSEICELEHLKNLKIGAYGLISLPDDFAKLGKSLESLNLDANNFTSVPSVLNKDNFPHLKSLSITGNRRWGTSDLRKANTFENGIGFHINMNSDSSVKNMFLWDTLEELRLSYNYIEGHLPNFKVGDNGIAAYTQADVDNFGGDTIKWLADNGIPKVLPNMKLLSINLNFLTGKLPDWLLYHPRLLDWSPDVLVFNQMEYGVDSNGSSVKFDNEPVNFEYYYEAFPKYRSKYEFSHEFED